jgi:3-oxoacyl-[acyl-carrier-protein] synthase-1
MIGDMPSIMAAGLCSPAPGPLADAAAVILAQEPLYERHPDFIGVDGMNQICAYVPGCVSERDPGTRLTYLLHAAYRDCVASIPADMDPAARFPLYLGLPVWMGRDGPHRRSFLAQVRRRDFSRMAGVQMYYDDNVAGLSAIEAAAAAIAKGEIEAALVAGVDSFVSPAVLDHLAFTGRARTRDTPYAPIPSEAAAMLLLTRQGLSGMAPLSNLRIVVRGEETEKLGDTSRTVMGRGLSRCIDAVVADLPKGEVIGALLCDMTGERHRAEEMGLAVARFPSTGQDSPEPILPALCIGNIGAAFGPVMAALAGFAPTKGSGHVLIWTSANSGERAAMCVDQVRQG